jgi:type IV secretory pathway VirB2 component (pilin)
MMDSIAKLFLGKTLAPARRFLCSGLLAVVVLGAPMIGAAAEVTEAANEGGLGVAAALTSIVYGPVKVVYSLAGTVVAGCAWVFSAGDSEVATTVLTRAVRGTYVITPAALRGEDEVEFIGRMPEYRASRETETPNVAAPPVSDESVYGW